MGGVGGVGGHGHLQADRPVARKAHLEDRHQQPPVRHVVPSADLGLPQQRLGGGEGGRQQLRPVHVGRGVPELLIALRQGRAAQPAAAVAHVDMEKDRVGRFEVRSHSQPNVLARSVQCHHQCAGALDCRGWGEVGV
eukprot:scaffold2835_cov105-Isochrysis_galbana.AAC.18